MGNTGHQCLVHVTLEEMGEVEGLGEGVASANYGNEGRGL